MITVVYCTRESKPEHIEHLIKSCGLGDKKIEVIEIINNGESLTKAYNRGLKLAKNNIVVFCHDDITIETKQWGSKLIKQFDRNPEFGIIGVAGSKHMGESGQWWSNPKKMYGRVQHTHEGKTWLSAYSGDLGDNLEEVVVCDGVWFAVDKNRLKTEFNEAVEGFHFYDVSFCFENLLLGVKVGVTTKIRVNHLSIGQTNEKWEENRVKFVEQNKDNLPFSVLNDFKNKKIKVLLACLNFNSLTGSELYFYELAKGLVKQGCEVHIYSNIGGILEKKAKKLGIKLHHLNQPPSYKLGDGRWLIKTQNGDIPSKENMLYKVSSDDFDVIHSSHKPITDKMVSLYPNTPIVSTIHSEIIALENPVISDKVKKYISIRPEITQHLIENYGINEKSIELIYNPIDTDRFNLNNIKNDGYTLFVGTIDYLRKNAILDLISQANTTEKKLVIVGKENGVDIKSLINGSKFVEYHQSTENVDRFTKNCDETASILLGRTTIEGWLCGKDCLIYDVNSMGDINSKKLVSPPNNIDEFSYVNVSEKIIKIYKEVINEN
jgi:hypothetical protein